MSIISGNEPRGAVCALAVMVLMVCLIAYGQALDGPLFFDDIPNLMANELVQIDGGDVDGWRVAAISSDSGLLYRPVSMLTFALNHVVSGSFSAFSLKATNLALHLIIGTLVYFLALVLLATPALRALRLGAYPGQLVALIAASLWLLHPIHVSTVLYAVQRMAQLSVLFTLGGLLLFVRYRLRWAASGAGPGELLAAFTWLLLFAFVAAFSKENGALLPWLIAVIEVTLFRGIWQGQPRRSVVTLGWCVLLLPLLVLALVFLVSPEVLSGRFGGREFTLEERLLTQGRVLWQYLAWMLVPNIVDMGFFHDDFVISRSLWSPLTTVLALMAWAGVLVACVLWHRRYPLVVFAFLFYLVGHAMESTVWPLEMVFEHRNYLPSVGFALLAAVGMVKGVARVNGLRLRAVVGGILGALVVLLAVRTHAWSDEITLARFNVVNHPQSPRANFFYANALFKRFEQAGVLGLDEDEKRALAVASRGYFERMHRLDEGDLAALVMLYQLDTLYFPGLGQENDWLGEVIQSTKNHRMKSSDRTALGALVGFSLTAAGEQGRPRVGELLEQLSQRYPWRMDLLAKKYSFLAAQGDDGRAALLASLESAALLNPQSQQVYALLAQYHGVENLDSTYEAIRQWMKQDELRRELPLIREIFEN